MISPQVIQIRVNYSLKGDTNSQVSLPFQTISDEKDGVQIQQEENEQIILFNDEEELKPQQVQLEKQKGDVNEQKHDTPNFVFYQEQQIQEIQMEEKKEIAIQSPLKQVQQKEETKQVAIDYESHFYKRSPHKLQSNQLFYCTIEKKIFKYYHLNNKKIPQGVIDFDTQEYQFECKKDKKNRVLSFTFKPEGTSKAFEFHVQNKKDESNDDWVYIIQNYLRFSQGRMKHLQGLALSYRYWRHNKISESDVRDFAQTGDLLILRSKGVLPAMQRSVTGSDYDHIVMFLKDQTKSLMLYETSNQFGVTEFGYVRFVQVRSYSQYEKYVLELYNFQSGLSIKGQRTYQRRIDKLYQSMQHSRQVYIQTTINEKGKGYSLSPMKLIGQSKRQNFFCSELISYLYQTIGLLPENVKACHYLPGHFSNEKLQLKLLKGAQFSEDFLVDFYGY